MRTSGRETIPLYTFRIISTTVYHMKEFASIFLVIILYSDQMYCNFEL